VQLTDFENAAFTAFIVLLSRVLLVFDLDFLLPLSKVDENMRRAHIIDAVNTQKFWFRRDVVPSDVCQLEPRPSKTAGDTYAEMSMRDIVCGKGSFPGLVPLCYAYLDHIECDSHSYARIEEYMTFIERRAKGELLTPATWMRRFVRSHPEYKKDSVITHGIAYDLTRACDEIGRGQRACPELLGSVVIKPISQERAYDTHLHSAASDSAIAKLLQQVRKRARDEDGPGSVPSVPRRMRARSSSY